MKYTVDCMDTEEGKKVRETNDVCMRKDREA